MSNEKLKQHAEPRLDMSALADLLGGNTAAAKQVQREELKPCCATVFRSIANRTQKEISPEPSQLKIPSDIEEAALERRRLNNVN